MLVPQLLAAVLAVTVPTAPPAAQPTAPPTIVTVISSPYCNALADHFNGALIPMLANDHVFDLVSVQMDNINTLFSKPDYVERYVHVRDAVGRQEAEVNQSLLPIQNQINLLRSATKVAIDPQAASQIRLAAQFLQTAYDHQRQLAIDLHNLHLAMLLDYNVMTAPTPVPGGFDPVEMTQPTEMRNIKDYLRFDRQRNTIADNEDHAVTIAYTAAQSYCVPKK